MFIDLITKFDTKNTNHSISFECEKKRTQQTISMTLSDNYRNNIRTVCQWDQLNIL